MAFSVGVTAVFFPAVDAPDHLVLHLHEIAGVEERRLLEERVRDALRARIEGAALPKGSDFRVGALAGSHCVCKVIYAAQSARGQAATAGMCPRSNDSS